jgi:hypothetical protein
MRNRSLEEVGQIIRSHSLAEQALVVLIHGSFAQGTATPSSDVDVISIHQESIVPSAYMYADGLEIDLHRISLDALEAHFGSLPADNNSPILRACLHGYVVIDRMSTMTAIRERALAIWNRGPLLPCPEEAEEMRMHSLKLVRSLVKPIRRSGESDEEMRFAWIRVNRVFWTLVMRYYVLHGLWTEDIQKLIADASANMPRFYSICRSYLEALSLEEALAALRSLGDACLGGELLDDGQVVGGTFAIRGSERRAPEQPQSSGQLMAQGGPAVSG